MAWGSINIGGGGNSGSSGGTTSYQISLSADKWKVDNKYEGYNFRYDYALSSATTNTIANLILDIGSVSAASESGMSSTSETGSGVVYFYSSEAPEVDLTGTLYCTDVIPLSSILEGFNPSDYATKNDLEATQTMINSKAPAFTYGVSDLTPGVSPLPDGTVYFVIE